MKRMLFILLGLVLVVFPLYAVVPMIAQGSNAFHTVILNSEGKIYAWGQNSYGQLGNSYQTDSSVPVAVNTDDVLSDKTITMVAAGGYFTVALDSDGKVYTWGNNDCGQLGADNLRTMSAVPITVETGGVLSDKTITAIATGRDHTIVLDSNGKVYTWGKNNAGQLGNNSTVNSSVPVAVNTDDVLSGKTITAIAAGEIHTVVMDSEGKIYAWGYNGVGQLGNNSTSSSSVPVAVTADGILSEKTITAIAAGGYHTEVLDSNGKVYTWGRNNSGQLGDNSNSTRKVPVAVEASDVLQGKTIVSITAGWSHTAVVDSDGKVYSFGSNSTGQLGNNSIVDSSIPVAVNTDDVLMGKTIISASAGYSHTIALDSDDNFYSWGYNFFGQLGDNTTTDSYVPVKVLGLDDLGELPLPITLLSFSALTQDGSIVLSWQTASEVNNSHFVIYRNNEFLASVDGAGTSSSTHNYTYVDDQTIPGSTYNYMLADVSYANEETKYPDKILNISVPENEIPAKFELETNYPNPFNPSTSINYLLPEAGNVDLSIYDINGKIVTTLLKEYKQAGNYSITWDASRFNTGIYFYRLTAGDYVKTNKMVYIK